MKRSIAILLAGLGLVFGCVNIPSKFEAHITVDIRQHIEQQAGNMLDYIEGKTNAVPAQPAAPAPGKTSWLERAREVLSPIQVAYAAELKRTSGEITRIANELRNRFEQIQTLKKKGYLGESNRGYAELRNPEKIANAEERNEAQRLAAAENKDRKALYQEVARLNKDQNVSISLVERIYAQERLNRAKPGEIFQLPPKGPDFDAFKASPAGQRLGAACQPDAWVTTK